MVLSQPDNAAEDEKDAIHPQLKPENFRFKQQEKQCRHACTHRQTGDRHYKSNNQALWPKAALSATVFIFSHFHSVWLHELFISGMTVQLLMKQSSRPGTIMEQENSPDYGYSHVYGYN